MVINFRGNNFHGYTRILENSENYYPRKFPAIRYIKLSYLLFITLLSVLPIKGSDIKVLDVVC